MIYMDENSRIKTRFKTIKDTVPPKNIEKICFERQLQKSYIITQICKIFIIITDSVSIMTNIATI